MGEQASGQQPAAGWMKDPSGRHFGRYWDGQQWTDHVISAETVPSIDPAGQRDGEPRRVPAKEDRPEPASAQESLAGWRKDPSGRHSSRYWDGWRWTEHVMSAARVPSIDPVPQRKAEARRTEPAMTGTRVAPAAARTGVMPASVESQPLDRPRSRPLPLRAWEGFRGWTRSSQWALGIIVSGMIVNAVAPRGGPARPTVRNDPTTVTRPVETTAPSAAAQLDSTTPPTAQAPITAPTTPANAGAPATTPGTAPGSQPVVTSPPFVEPPTTVPHPGEPADLDATTTS